MYRSQMRAGLPQPLWADNQLGVTVLGLASPILETIASELKSAERESSRLGTSVTRYSRRRRSKPRILGRYRVRTHSLATCRWGSMSSRPATYRTTRPEPILRGSIQRSFVLCDKILAGYGVSCNRCYSSPSVG